ncbi:hypothetical protein [Neobacillus mesonae]|uniref:hypothetical protein n=1 Tax=Neobacillus mesonae TaxID=1193713 RepID=UPI00203EB537|nr:hypothetical protein [Neobacillus mesonae]MCM3570287.1 hypothetical protein [Neobacillus mesonae]
MKKTDNPHVMGLQFVKGSGRLVEKVNRVLIDIREDRAFLKKSKKWFGEDVSPQ